MKLSIIIIFLIIFILIGIIIYKLNSSSTLSSSTSSISSTPSSISSTTSSTSSTTPSSSTSTTSILQIKDNPITTDFENAIGVDIKYNENSSTIIKTQENFESLQDLKFNKTGDIYKNASIFIYMMFNEIIFDKTKNNISDEDVSVEEFISIYKNYWNEMDEYSGDSSELLEDILKDDYKLSDEDVKKVMDIYDEN
jgi:hypothetical protein